MVFDREQAGPVLGWTSAADRPLSFRVFGEQIKATTPETALWVPAFYTVCIVLNWWFYLRKNAYACP